MPARSSWKGYLKLSLVSVPVKGYTASSAATTIRLNQLHAECHSRIRYQKTCPIHGEVARDEIVSGYEYAKGQYVVIDPAEIKQLRADSDDAISVDAIVRPGTIDPLYFTEKTYYLVPDGAIGQKPFALIQHCLEEDNLQAVARVVLFGRDELVILRPVERLLAMTALKYDAEVTKASTLSEELEGDAKLSGEEVSLTKTLLKSFVKKGFSITNYHDEYVEKLRQLIEAKVAGKELVSPPPVEEPQVISLMDALKKSLAQTGNGEEAAPKRKRKIATSERRPKAASKQRRKSG